MPTDDEINRFWSAKSPDPEYLAVEFGHAEFDTPIRLVANQFAPVTLGGNVHTPCAMSIKPPEQNSDPIARFTVTFPRAVVGREFKRRLKAISVGGRLSPITVAYRHYIGSDLTTPAMSWQLYVARDSGIVFTAEAVQVTATDANPMRLDASVIYDPSVFTGLRST